MDRQRLVATTRAVAAATERLRAVADSPDGFVRATVDGHGVLVELELDPRLYREPDAYALAETITTTVRAAHDLVQRRLARLAAPLVPGADPETLDPRFGPLLHWADAERRA